MIVLEVLLKVKPHSVYGKKTVNFSVKSLCSTVFRFGNNNLRRTMNACFLFIQYIRSMVFVSQHKRTVCLRGKFKFPVLGNKIVGDFLF